MGTHDSPTDAVQYPSALWTSADRYARYGATVRALDENLGGSGTVLDVGDPSGYLALFSDRYQLTCADLNTDQVPLDGTVRLLANGTRLPFADGSFDAVVSNDALEHVPAELRERFLAELTRVASRVVVVAAPFDTTGVFGAEEFVRRFAFVSTGRSQDQLEEHAEHGLPKLGDTEECFARLGASVASFGNGNLQDWVLNMLIKHQSIARPELAPLDQGADMVYSALFDSRNDVGPFYRQIIIASKSGDARTPPPAHSNSEPEANSPGFLTALIAAGTAEAARADLAHVDDGLAALHQRLDGDFASLHDAVGVGDTSLSREIARLRSDVESLRRSSDRIEAVVVRIIEIIRHPISTITRRGRDADGVD